MSHCHQRVSLSQIVSPQEVTYRSSSIVVLLHLSLARIFLAICLLPLAWPCSSLRLGFSCFLFLWLSSCFLLSLGLCSSSASAFFSFLFFLSCFLLSLGLAAASAFFFASSLSFGLCSLGFLLFSSSALAFCSLGFLLASSSALASQQPRLALTSSSGFFSTFSFCQQISHL